MQSSKATKGPAIKNNNIGDYKNKLSREIKLVAVATATLQFSPVWILNSQQIGSVCFCVLKVNFKKINFFILN